MNMGRGTLKLRGGEDVQRGDQFLFNGEEIGGGDRVERERERDHSGFMLYVNTNRQRQREREEPIRNVLPR